MICLIPAAFLVAAQRCRDLNQTGWFVLFAFIPLLNLVLFFALYFVPGTKGPNRYGPDPLEEGPDWNQGSGQVGYSPPPGGQQAFSTPPPVAQNPGYPQSPQGAVAYQPNVQSGQGAIGLYGFSDRGDRVNIEFDRYALSSPSGEIIGRDPSSRSSINDPQISRQHIAIKITQQGLMVRDLGSTNGTVLNGRKLSPNTDYPLVDGDRLELGGHRLSVRAPS